MNKQLIAGCLGQDARIGAGRDGNDFIAFSVAANSGYGEYKRTEWVDCIRFGKGAANMLPYLKQGKKVVVTGDCWSEEYQGTHKRKLRVDSMELVSPKDETI